MTDNKFELVIATFNPGKIRELCEMLSGLPVRAIPLSTIEGITEVAETGSSFAENASLKAAGYAIQTGKWTLADDSGLEVEALGGAPGVFSARYAGENSRFDIKMRRLLAELDTAAATDRSARFVSVIALADPRGRIAFSSEGICLGRIAAKPSGTGGFGFDPLFIPEGYERTFGEIPDAIKNEISHRTAAARKFIRYLTDFIEVSLDQTHFRL